MDHTGPYGQLAADLEAFDNALKLVAPDLDIPAIAPKMVKPPEDWSKRGEMSRQGFGIMRASQRPLTSREIASQDRKPSSRSYRGGCGLVFAINASGAWWRMLRLRAGCGWSGGCLRRFAKAAYLRDMGSRVTRYALTNFP
jgi:hypothetical protein